MILLGHFRQRRAEVSNKPCSIRPSICKTNSWIISIFSSSTTCSFSSNTFWLSSTISLFHSPASFSILSSFSLSHSPTPSSNISSSISLSPSIGCLSPYSSPAYPPQPYPPLGCSYPPGQYAGVYHPRSY